VIFVPDAFAFEGFGAAPDHIRILLGFAAEAIDSSAQQRAS
jgi:hypothetical protein